jgi:hypothetical protein
MSHQKPDPTSTFLPPNPKLPADPAPITAPFFKSNEPALQPISKGPFSGDLNPFAQPQNPFSGAPTSGNLMGPNHFPFASPPSADHVDGPSNVVKPKFDPFGPVPGMGKFNSD